MLVSTITHFNAHSAVNNAPIWVMQASVSKIDSTNKHTFGSEYNMATKNNLDNKSTSSIGRLLDRLVFLQEKLANKLHRNKLDILA